MTGCSSRLTGNCGASAVAGAAHVRAPGGQLRAALLDGDGFVVRHVVHFAAEGVERGHAVALGLGQQDESQRQIGRAFAGDRPALLHDVKAAGWRAVRFRRGSGGKPPVSASVGLRGRCLAAAAPLAAFAGPSSCVSSASVWRRSGDWSGDAAMMARAAAARLRKNTAQTTATSDDQQQRAEQDQTLLHRGRRIRLAAGMRHRRADARRPRRSDVHDHGSPFRRATASSSSVGRRCRCSGAACGSAKRGG